LWVICPTEIIQICHCEANATDLPNLSIQGLDTQNFLLAKLCCYTLLGNTELTSFMKSGFNGKLNI